jgi:hypothetical protein
MRRSDVVYIVVRLVIDGEDWFLLREHEKWGDLSLVGGHVEPNEIEDWPAAACREANEELAPLECGRDFDVVALPGGPERMGPRLSRSAGGSPTMYELAWFALIFLVDPVTCLARLSSKEFGLVKGADILSTPTDLRLSPLLANLALALRGGFSDIPPAWPSLSMTPTLAALSHPAGRFAAAGVRAPQRGASRGS